MINNAVVVGYGSAGKRHTKQLLKLNFFNKIFIITKQNIDGYETLHYINDIKEKFFSYVVICSETSLHYEHLKFFESNFKNKIILVEKPLFDSYKLIKIQNNKIFVAYDLRLNSSLFFIKNYIQNKKVFNVRVTCCSNLREWRKNRDYKESYSADKLRGGGVLLDLSHEIDYLLWIFKNPEVNFAYNSKISNLKINSDDFLNIFGKFNKKTLFQLTLNYFSLIPERKIIIDGNNFFISADLIKNQIKMIEGNNKKISKTFIDNSNIHQLVINNNFNNICTYSEAVSVMKLINKIKKINISK